MGKQGESREIHTRATSTLRAYVVTRGRDEGVPYAIKSDTFFKLGLILRRPNPPPEFNIGLNRAFSSIFEGEFEDLPLEGGESEPDISPRGELIFFLPPSPRRVRGYCKWKGLHGGEKGSRRRGLGIWRLRGGGRKKKEKVDEEAILRRK
eukprot:385882-Amorphochlora_amoeboformis.AAC.1